MTPLDGLDLLIVALAAVAAGAVNALAGGGTLITFPVLVAVGVPALAANVTNTVALCPGYLGASWAQRADLVGQERRLWWAIPAAAVGGLLGAALLIAMGQRLFTAVVPYLILIASGLLAVHEPMRKWTVRRAAASGSAGLPERAGAVPVGLAAVYGGYFGAGLSVIVLAALAVVLDDSLNRLNALKQVVGLAVNVAAALFFVLSGPVVWSAVGVMAVGALVGGALGGRLAGRVRPETLRRVVVTVGIIIGLVYLVR